MRSWGLSSAVYTAKFAGEPLRTIFKARRHVFRGGGVGGMASVTLKCRVKANDP